MGAMIRAMRWRFDPLSLLWAVVLFLVLVLLATAVTVVVLRVLVHPFFDRAVRRTASTMAQVAMPPPLVHDTRELEPVRA